MISVKQGMLSFLLLNMVWLSYGQEKITGKIIDIDNKVTLSKANIKNYENQIITVSNLDGTFEINKPGVYTFKKEGYHSKTFNLKSNTSYIIQLKATISELNEVVVTANQIPKKIKEATASINIISSKEIKQYNSTDFAPVLNSVPGVFMQNGALNTNRITIRGIGSRNLFGTSKIRAYYKDIPLTNGSGETTIEDFELATISRFEITKGASSSAYGAGLGGVINILPQNALLNETTINAGLSIGSFGLIKEMISLNHGTKINNIKALYSNTHSDGYRENNNYDRQTLTITSNHSINNNNELSFIASYVDLKAFIPSSLNETTYLNEPKSAAFTWKQSQGFEDAKRGIFGLSWNHNFNIDTKLITSVFSSFRDAYEPRPFNVLKENTLATGIRTRILGASKLFLKTLNWTVGGELFKDTYKYQTFENLYQDFPNGTGSIEGNQLSNFKEKRTYYNLFFETNYKFSKKILISIGLNLNETAYKLKDKYIATTTNPDQSGDFKFKNIVSPKFGLSHSLSKNINLFTSISHGFSPISLNETLLPDGQINTNLKPETGWNYEIGTRGRTLNNKLQFSASIYQLNIKNLLVSRRTAEDEFIGINAGSTQHNGLELDFKYKWFQNKAVTINSFTNYSLNNFKFKEFIDGNNDFSGNDLTGVPSSIFNAGIDFSTKLGFYGNINFQSVGSMPITDSNSLYSDKYNLTNLKFGYLKNIHEKWELNVFLGINNVFDETYASQILINASSFGGNAPRYYYPGNPTNYYTGLNLSYTIK